MNRQRLFVAFACALPVACGGSQPPAEPVVVVAPTDAVTVETPAPAASPWDSVTREQLVTLVRDGAAQRIREIQPDLDPTQLPAWAAEPSTAPELADRVAEQTVHLAIAAAAAGENELAERLLRLVRAKARNRNNAFTGSTLLAELARRSAPEPEAQQAAITRVFAELPRNRFGAATLAFQLFQNEGQVRARIEQLHQQLLSLETAADALFYEAVLLPIVQNRPVFTASIEAVRADHARQPEPRPYAFSTVDLTTARDAQPIVVGVWDTGTASHLFESQLFTNPNEQANGQDDDGNGLVDDLHGVVSDPTDGQTGLFFDPGEEVVREYSPSLRGIMDLRAGMASTEAAQRVLAMLGGVQDAGALDRLEQNLDAISEWGHGTHVAGILVAGIPQARLAVFRSAWAGEARLYRHRGPTDEELAAERANIEQVARFINAHNVRVVNVSLGFQRDYVEGELRHDSARYPTDQHVRARAREIHAARMANWRLAFEQAPNTLFVVAAGNSNRDVIEYEDVPTSLDLPNVLSIGAVDRTGDWAIFTNSNPQRVRVFDFGVEVESVVPNGERIPLSGTSMASPNVANLAAKMIALDPALTPQRTMQIIEETGEPIAAPFNGRVAHEARAIARVRRERRRTPRAAR